MSYCLIIMIYITICNHDEKWAYIKDIYKNVREEYLISSYGNLINKNTGKYLKHIIETRGYHCVNLSLINGNQRRYYIHDLVAKSFIIKLGSEYNQVNHINGLKCCNYIENLEWVTPMYNIQHSIQTGLRKDIKGINHHKNIYDEKLIHKICGLIEKGLKPRFIIKEVDLTCKEKQYAHYKRLIKHIKRKEQWTHISQYYNF